MGIEIERKFLVDSDKWKSLEKPKGEFFRQAYLVTEKSKSIRVRQTPTTAFLTIKGQSEGLKRLEFEYEIPLKEADELIENLAVAELIKTRYKIEFKGKLWEIDEFSGENEGLILAEIELNSENETVEFPDWIGKEVSSDERYYNANLSVKPFKKWKISERN